MSATVQLILLLLCGGGFMLAQGYFMGRTGDGQRRPSLIAELAERERRNIRRYVGDNAWALLLGVLGCLMVAAGLLLGQSFGPDSSLPTLGSLVIVACFAILWREYVRRSRR